MKKKNAILNMLYERLLILAEFEPNDRICDAYTDYLRSMKKEQVEEPNRSI